MGTYSYSGTPTRITVGAGGTYTITGDGAAGGYANVGLFGGSGAEATGSFQLTAGEKLEIFVGGVGKTGTYQGSGYGGGGGGGTFVLGSTNGGATYTPLLIAGGGGGAGRSYGNGGAAPAILSTTGGSGGTSGSYGSGGGAGLMANGASGTSGSGNYVGAGGTSVTSPTTPGAGGIYKSGHNSNTYAGSGGFGGGGGGGGFGYGGGGGGYTGGNGSYDGGGGPATGGTSFVAPSATGTSAASAASENAANMGNGQVLITPTPVCYVSGTLIRTMRGDVLVEALRVGDLVETSSGAHRPIRWLAHRTLGARALPSPASGRRRDHDRNDGRLTPDAWPIRIAAHAFGENRPARALWVSPGHSICVNVVEEVLIPASSLVNGTTVQQVEVDEITYWHVELDSHDILIAENLPAESYIEMGNRGFFREADVVGLDALPDAPLEARTHADFCRPFHSEGPLVEVVRSHLRIRRATLGWTLAHDPLADLHLIADGVRLEPAIRDLTARFSVPAGARDVWLVSNTTRPCEIGDSIDIRDLGIYLTGLAIDDGFEAPRQIDMSDPLLCVGFHALEDNVRRWTAGRARLPAALWKNCPEGFFLRIELGVPALPRWVTPAETMVARQAA